MMKPKVIHAVNCTFCKIINGQAPGRILYKDDFVTALHDINPVAPIHILIVPNKHIATVNELEEEDALVMGRLFITAKKLAAVEGISGTGYRLILNTGRDGGQMIYHLHLHLIGGSQMRYPMG